MYKQTEAFTCGPSAYIEEFSLIKDKTHEMEFHEIGRVKPSRIFLGVSFLEINPRLNLLITDMDMPQGVIDISFNPQVDDFITKIRGYYAALMDKHRKNIQIIDDNPGIIINALMELVKKNKKILFLTDSSFWMGKGGLHWITIKGLDKDKFICGDPRSGRLINFSHEDLKTQMLLVKKAHCNLQFVTD